MNIATFSPALVLLFVCALLWILMDIHFRELTRFQKWLIPLVILLLAVFNHVLRLELGAATYGSLIILTMHLPYFLLFLYITKCGVIKMTFMILTAVVFMAPTVFVGNFVKQFFADSPWGLLLANLVTYGSVLLLAQFVFRQSFHYMIKFGSNQFFLRFSLVPILYYIYLFAAMNLDFSSLNSMGGYVARILPTIYVFVFYFLLLRSYKELDEKREMETVRAALSQQLASTKEQIALLNEAQTQTAIYQHEMRHHLTAIDAYLSAENPQQAKEYIQKVQADVEAITPTRFCENELVNLLCSSFSGKAARLDVRLSVEAKLSKNLSISDTELCSVISNGLENALHAVAPLEESYKWVELFCGLRLNKLLIEIKNPYAGEIAMQDGLPVSHHEGHGYGCRSIRTIAEQNGGLCTFEPEHGVFTLRVMLPLLGLDNGYPVR